MDNQLEMALRLAKEGRKEGFKFLYEKTCDAQLCMAMELVEDIAGAQSVVQQAYQQVFDQIQEVQQMEAFEPWLSDMVSYFAMQWVRMHGAFREPEEVTYHLEEDDMSIAEYDDDPEVSASFTNEETDAMLTRILSELTEEEKICMVMHYQYKKTIAQVAYAVGCTEQAAESLIASGKNKVQNVTGVLAQDDSRVRFRPIPFFLSLLRMKTANLAVAGAAGTAATFQIAGTAVSFGAAGTAAGMTGASAVGAAGAAGTVAGTTGASGGAAGMTGASAAGTASGGASAASSAGTAIGHGFLHTLGAKIAAGVAATAIVGGTAGGIILYNSHKKPAATTETTETTTETVTTVASTEATTEAVVNEEYKKAYRTVLQDHESTIRGYEQMRWKLESTDWPADYEETAPIAIEDVTGDDIPELIYIENTQTQGDGHTMTAALSIYTCEDGKVRQIYYLDSWDVQVAGGAAYSLFKIEGDSRLYDCNGMADSFSDEIISRLDVQEDGMLKATQILNRHIDYEDENGTHCEAEGQGITQEEFQTKLDALTGKITKVLMYNSVRDDTMAANMKKAEQAYMTYDEAIAFLSDGQQSQDTAGADAKLPFTEAQEFIFSSGVGGWETYLTINPDGTFTGQYHDSNLGESGDGYDSTVYISTFHGRFKDIRKKDDLTYTMKLDTLETEETQDTWIEEQDGARIMYIASPPYGMDGGTNFELYLAGTQKSNLPDDYISWIGFALGDRTSLPGYGVYNVEGACGFSGTDW